MTGQKHTNDRAEKLGNIVFYGFLALLTLLLVYTFQPLPPDDFLRHVRYIDYESLGGYTYMFPHSLFEQLHFNPWYGFDLLSGKTAALFGLQNTVFLFELLFCLLYGAALFVNIRSPKPVPLVIMILLFFGSYTLERVFLIRPAIFLGILLLFGLRGKGLHSGLLGTFVSALLYYLFWIYTIPLAIAHYFRGDKKFSYGLGVGSILSLGLWMAFSQGEYLMVISELFRALFGGREGISIQENILSLLAFTNPVVLFIFLSFLLTWLREKQSDIFLTLALLTAPAAIQLRYFMDITCPLMLLYTINHNLQSLNKLYTKYKPVFAIASFIPLALVIPTIASFSPGGKLPDIKGINLPKGAVVFTDSGSLNFRTVFYNKEPLQVLPATEIGWNDNKTKETFLGIREKRRIDTSVCNYLQSGGVNYVLSTREVTAACLKPIQTFRQKGSIRDVTLYEVLRGNRKPQEGACKP